jgi:hypothetical protein
MPRAELDHVMPRYPHHLAVGHRIGSGQFIMRFIISFTMTRLASKKKHQIELT